MNMFYKSTFLLLCLFGALQLSAQERIFNIPYDINAPGGVVDIYEPIMGDTTATGERVDNNTIYTLDNEGVYIVIDRIENTKDWPLQIQAVDLASPIKPFVTRIPNDAGSYPKVFYPRGDMTLKNLQLVTGDKGPGEENDWGQIRIFGDSTTIIVEDCIIEKDRGGFLQLRANGVKAYVNRCVFRNGGNRKILQGNGRGIDSRNFVWDTLVVKNSVIHNIIDRVFRSQGGIDAHGHIEFDRNTIFNVAGRHGCFQLRWVKSAKITNNIMINPMMLGTTPAFTDEQIQPDNEAHKIITLDTVTAETQLEIKNNNIIWTQDVIDAWAAHDSVSAPANLSMLVKQVMGADTADAFFTDSLGLNNVPQNMTQYVIDLYADPTAIDMFDHIVEDSTLAGTDRDFGNLFNFNNFDPCYDQTAASATAATDGGPVGFSVGCAGLANSRPEINENLGLTVAPNPFAGFTNVSFTLDYTSATKLTVYDLNGRLVQVLADEVLNMGDHEINWNPQSSVAKGMYILRLETENGFMTQKMLVQ